MNLDEIVRSLNASLENLRKSHPKAYADLVNETSDPFLSFINLGRRTFPSENAMAVLAVRHPRASKELLTIAHAIQQLKFGKVGAARIVVDVAALPRSPADSGQFLTEQVIRIVVDK